MRDITFSIRESAVGYISFGHNPVTQDSVSEGPDKFLRQNFTYFLVSPMRTVKKSASKRKVSRKHETLQSTLNELAMCTSKSRSVFLLLPLTLHLHDVSDEDMRHERHKRTKIGTEETRTGQIFHFINVIPR
jgi:hypothetical protein